MLGLCQSTRRDALRLVLGSLCLVPKLLVADDTSRELHFDIKDEFGTAPRQNIERVLKAAADEIWQHCDKLKFTASRFSIYRNRQFPITHFKHDEANRLVIGLNTQDLYWAQYAYQFSHEFCHAVIDHTDARQQAWHSVKHANHWLDECLCETASLFVLRAMSRSWLERPPYPNWKSFAPRLSDYVDERLQQRVHQLPAGMAFVQWFNAELPSLRENATQREKNTIIAAQLLPVFERHPKAWATVAAIKLGPRDTERSFVEHVAAWRTQVRDDQQSSVDAISNVFGIEPAANA